MGVAAETTFLRGALDKLGVEPQLDKRYEYKSAADRIMRTEFTPEHREAVDRVVESTWESAPSTTIARGRGLGAEHVRDANRPRTAGGRRRPDAGLVDRIGYRDEVYADVRARRRRRRRAAVRRPVDAAAQRRPAASAGPRDFVALVEAHGEIVVGRSRLDAARSARWAATPSARRCARRARTSTRKAVLFRIDSPGGSAVALRHDLARGRADPRAPASRSSCRWARWPAPAATTSPARPT